MRRVLCFFIGLQLLSVAVLAQNGDVSNKMCFTTDIFENQREPQDFIIQRLIRSSLRNASWNVNQGYGSGCTNDCIMTTAASCSKFRIPVVFTISTQPGCGISIPTQANIDAQIAISNDFFACQNVPIEFYKSITYAGHPTTGDMSTRSQNIGCTYSASVLNDVPNVLNIYIFSNTTYGTSPNGWAILPSGTTAPLRVIMSRAAFNSFSYTPGTLNCGTPNLGNSIVLIHEFGHILGLHHTHNELNATKECPDMTNSCNGGDYIFDTDADPGLHLSCAAGSGGCDKAPNGCTSPCATPYPTDINTENNIMSYNNTSNCRTTFTPCQKAKLIDALLCARGPQMCDRNINLEFANGSDDAYYEICVGDPAPTFTATSSCYAWYATLGVATPLSSNSSSFTPTLGSGAGQLNNNVPGVYLWYLGDLNEINPNCRTQLTIKVISDVGTPTVNSNNSFISSSCSMSDVANLTTTTSTLGTNEIIGWWVTQGSPISDVATDESSFNTALSTATINGTLSNPVNHLIQSTSGNPLKNLPLSFDCGPLDEGVNYYATPVLARYAPAVPDIVLNCTSNPAICGAGTGINFGCGYLVGGNFNTGPITGVPSNPPIAPTYTIQISNIVYPSTCTPGQMILDIRNATTQSFIYAGLPGNVSTITLNQSNFSGYNPANGFWILLYDQSNPCCTASPATISFNVTITITYPGTPAVAFPSFTGYSPCYFGDAVALNCACSCLPQANIMGDKSVICPGESTVLNASPIGNYNYIWNDNSMNVSLSISPSVTSNYTVTVTHTVVNCSSTSNKEIYVETGQNVFSTLDQGHGTLRHILECATDGDIITFDPSITLDLTDSLLITKNIELLGDPNASTTINAVSYSSQFGWKVATGKTLDLNDIKLNITTSGSPVLINQGTINLNHSEISGNHDPVVQNNGEFNIMGSTPSKIKKN